MSLTGCAARPNQRCVRDLQHRRTTLREFADICSENGRRILPIHTPYQRELLFEYVEATANRYGLVRLDALDQRWLVQPADDPRGSCDTCRACTLDLSYGLGERSFCGPCARLVLA